MSTRTSHWLAVIALGALLAASPALAAEPEKGAPAAPSAEQREKMAAAHQKMAECLRSSRPFADCRAEMKNACRDMMGDAGCPMMGHEPGAMGHGKDGGMMKGPPPPEPPQKN
jgi:hypothetical protein